MTKNNNIVAVVVLFISINILLCLTQTQLSTYCHAWVPSSNALPVRVSRIQTRNINQFSSTPTVTGTDLETINESMDNESINTKEILGKDPLKKWHNHCTQPGDRDILVRAARGEITERTPVWFMRQAGRYMEAFREYSNTIPFRERSENSQIAIELSLQCHRAYGMDGIIMFSDILTPLPTLGIEFDVIKGKGPVITTKITSEQDIDSMPSEYNFDKTVPFIKDILQSLSDYAEEYNTSLIGFIGSPFTLASYVLEQKSSKHCLQTKIAMSEDEANTNKMFSKFIMKLATMIGQYACYQIQHGAQVIQIFESWAHQLSPYQFTMYAKPAVLETIRIIKSQYPNTPVIYYANGGSSYLELQKDLIKSIHNTPEQNLYKADMIGIDWHISMEQARSILGNDIPISGNMDPIILRVGTKEQIESAARLIIDQAGGPGNKHLFNLGHGVMQDTPESNIKYLVDEIKRYSSTSIPSSITTSTTSSI